MRAASSSCGCVETRYEHAVSQRNVRVFGHGPPFPPSRQRPCAAQTAELLHRLGSCVHTGPTRRRVGRDLSRPRRREHDCSRKGQRRRSPGEARNCASVIPRCEHSFRCVAVSCEGPDAFGATARCSCAFSLVSSSARVAVSCSNKACCPLKQKAFQSGATPRACASRSNAGHSP
jgi:hypothetical protein